MTEVPAMWIFRLYGYPFLIVSTFLNMRFKLSIDYITIKWGQKGEFTMNRKHKS